MRMIALDFSCLLILFLAVFALLAWVLVKRSRQREAHSPVNRKIAQIARDFPDEVRAWGGSRTLEDPAAVRALIAKLESNS